ncbi:unnamed protein product [Discula destructiva]
MSNFSPAGTTATGRAEQTVQVPLQAIHFATFSADNAAAVHLLESIQASSSQTDSYSSRLTSSATSIGYHLVLSVPTDEPCPLARPPGTWRIGCGWNQHTTNANNKGVDILLCPPGGAGALQARQSIAPYHANITFHPESGVLLLSNIHHLPIIHKSRGNKTIVKGPKPLVLSGTTNQLIFGDYKFSLNFQDLASNEENFRSLRNEFIIALGGHPLPHLLTVPNSETTIPGDVWYHKSIRSNMIWVSGVSTQDGQPLSVSKASWRRRIRTREMKLQDQHDIARINTLSGAEGLVPILATWCEHGRLPPCKRGSNVSEDIYRSLPLMAYMFSTMPWEKLECPKACLRYCYQTLVGLNALHSENQVHGWIDPEMLWLLPDASARSLFDPARDADTWGPWMLPMRAAIAGWELGPPTTCRQNDAMTAAPELRRSSDAPLYTSKADIWSLGVSWMHAFHGTSVVNSISEAQELRSLANGKPTLNARLGKVVLYPRDALLSMLELEPSDRLDVQNLLQDPIWNTLRQDAEIVADKTKRVRFQTPPIDAGDDQLTPRPAPGGLGPRFQTAATGEGRKRLRLRQSTPEEQ